MLHLQKEQWVELCPHSVPQRYISSEAVYVTDLKKSLQI